MEVLLKENVDNLGDKNEIVTVKDGYGRNYLIPKKMAVIATESVKKMHAENMRQRQHKLDKLKKEAEAVAEKMMKSSIKVPAKLGQNDQIFGSITNVQLMEAIEKAGFNVERRGIKLADKSIKTLGTYKASVHLFKQVVADIEFEVVAE